MAVDVPVVVTIKFNGKVLTERTSLLVVPPGATWEGVARGSGLRLRRMWTLRASCARRSASASLFRSADALPSDRVAAAISGPVGAAYALGYAFAFQRAGARLCTAAYRWR